MEDAEAGKGYIGYYDGGAFGIPVTSKNKEAALLFLQYIGQDSVQGRLGGRSAAHHQHGDLRRSGGQSRWTRSSDGYYTMLRERRQALRRRPALPVPRPGA